MHFRAVPLFSYALLAFLLVGCGDRSGLDVAEGRYRLVVEGSLADTLTGPAIVRSHGNGRVSIELGARGGPGLSLEVTLPDRGADVSGLRTRRYDVMAASLLNGPTANSPSGIVAFFSIADRQFVATQGHLSVTDAGTGTVAGRIDVEMEEQESTTPGERTIRLRGTLRATIP